MVEEMILASVRLWNSDASSLKRSLYSGTSVRPVLMVCTGE